MSHIWFSADAHFGHANICAYAHRPQLRPGDWDPVRKWVSGDVKEARANEMNAMLIRNWNSRVKIDDTVYHLGDFCCKGGERGVSGTKTKAIEWLRLLNGNKVMILGNHDANNTLPRGLEYAMLDGGNLRFLLIHDPTKARLVPETAYDVCLCGHVHDRWAERVDEVTGKLCINVGVDVRKYMPITLSEVIGIVTKFRRQRNEQKS